MQTARRLGLVAVLAALAAAAVFGRADPGSASANALDCADAPYNGAVSGTVQGNFEVTVHGTICLITGTVEGNVTVRDDTVAMDFTECDALTAVNLVGGTINGNVRAAGGPCTMVWLRDGAEVGGNVIYQAAGNLGFLGQAVGATVHGNVLLGSGLLWATGASTANRVDGQLICNGGRPLEGLGSGSETNWDGADGDTDGTVAGHYLGC